ncbi:uncharacterized protein [Amphiura filiformis]|uniref:uncharacterized protein n=1 Tax=Amphiura filiformis TaxID=82378 RepID=UPI003B22058B
MAKATQEDIITQACDGALELIRKKSPERYADLEADPAKKEKLSQAARATATECVQLAAEFADKPGTDIAQRLAKHLSADRIKLIRAGLSIPTFRMDVTQKDNGRYCVELTRDDKSFMSGTRVFFGTNDVDWAIQNQYASILVEAVLLVMSAVGIAPDVSEGVMEQTVKDVAEAIESSSTLKRAVDDFIKAWNTAGEDAYEKAKAIFELIDGAFDANIFWTIVKSLCQDMAWYDWLETAAKVAAMIVAALATDGAALIAEIAEIVLDAVDFARKMANVAKLKKIREIVRKQNSGFH